MYVGILGAEQGLEPVDRQLLDDIDVLAAPVVALAWIAFGVLVGQLCALRLHHRWRGVVLAGDQLDVLFLAGVLERDRGPEFGVDVGEGGLVAGGLVVCAGVKGLFKSVLKVFLKVFESDEHNNIFASGAGFSQNANVKSGVTTFSVTHAGSGAYLFDQYSGNNPDIYLHPGQTISFNINASGHPFLIRQSNGGTLYNVGLTHVSTTGVVTVESGAQAKETGTLIWKVPFALTGNTYVYQCQNHSGMVGNLIIQSTVTAALAAATAATGDSLAFAIALG